MIGSFGRKAAMALACFSILSFEIFTTRLLGVVNESVFIIFAVAIAMLGLGTAASINSIGSSASRKPFDPARSAWLLLLLGLSYPLALALITAFSSANNELYDTALAEGGRIRLALLMYSRTFHSMAVVGAILFVPYFIFGTWITLFFRDLPPEDYHRFYAADLIGAAIGCVACLYVIEVWGFIGSMASIVGGALLSAILLSVGGSARRTMIIGGASAIALAALFTPQIAKHLEPEPSVNVAGRNYDLSKEVTERWRRWTPLSRLAQLDLHDRTSGNLVNQVHAHGDGEGWAHFINSREGTEGTRRDLSELTLSLEGRKILVLFAGTGADMMYIDRACGGACDITGVEINRLMVDHAMEIGSDWFKAFHAQDHVNLVVAEAREYLARDTETYDAILLSWYGAGRAQFIGTAAGLSYNLYTAEAFADMIDHLNPGGVIVTFNGSKAQTISTLQHLGRDAPSALRGQIVLVRAEDEPVFESTRLKGQGESLRMIFKPDGFSAADLEKVEATTARLGLQTVLSPTFAHPEWPFHARLADGEPLDRVNEDIYDQTRLQIRPVVDDWPFLHNLIPTDHLINPATLMAPTKDYAESIYRGTVGMTLALAITSILIIIGPLLLRAGPERSPRNGARLIYFACLGLGFMLVEVGLIRKLGLILGHPTYAISVVLAALILSTGVGALLFERLTWKPRRSERAIVLSLVGLLICLFLAYDLWAADLISLPLEAKFAVVAVALFPVGVMMGQLFPYGLRVVGEEDPRLIPWAWAINATMSTIGVGVGYLLSFVFGFTMVIYAGAVVYLVILALPRLRPAAAPLPNGLTA